MEFGNRGGSGLMAGRRNGQRALDPDILGVTVAH